MFIALDHFGQCLKPGMAKLAKQPALIFATGCKSKNPISDFES
jgi:hypothetical protein